MGKSCNIVPQVRKKGSDLLVDSILWPEIYKNVGKNRKKAIALYAISKDEQFRKDNHFDEEAHQDENGEPKFEDFLIAINQTKETLNTVDYLEGQLPKLVTPYATEAIDIVTQFNNNMRENSRLDYMATFKKDSKGMYHISVVKDTIRHRNQLVSRVRNETLEDKFRLYLQRLGFTYTTIDADESLFTKGIEDKVDGFYNVIQISEGLLKINDGRPFDVSLAQNCGFLAVTIMQDSPLMQRLLSMLSDKAIYQLQQELMYSPRHSRLAVVGEIVDAEGNKVEIKEEIATREEMAGVLLANAMLKGSENKSWIGKFADRVWNGLRRVFASSGAVIRKNKTLSKQHLLAETNAVVSRLVKDFVSLDTNNEIIGKVADLKLVPFGDIPEEQKAYTEIMSQMKASIERLKSYKGVQFTGASIEDFINKYYAADNIVTDENGVPYSPEVQRQLLLDRIAEAVVNIYGELEFSVGPALEELEGIDDFDPSDTKTWYENFRSNMNILRGARETLMLASIINEEARNLTYILLNEDKKYSDTTINPLRKVGITARNATVASTIQSDNLVTLQNKLGELLNRATTTVMAKQKKAFCEFLQIAEGGDSIPYTARVLFNDADTKAYLEDYYKRIGTPKNLREKPKSLTAVPAINKPIIEILEQCNDISLFSRFVASMCNNEDVIGALIDKQVKRENKAADDQTYKDASTVLDLYKEMLSLGFKSDFSEFIETYTDKDGNEVMTGNFIQEKNWGEWEDLMSDHYKKWHDEFKSTHTTYDMSDDIRNGEELAEFLKDRVKEFHDKYSKPNPDPITGIVTYEPSDAFINPKWAELTQEKQDHIKKWIALKASKEGNIRGAVSYRLPQISGSAAAMLPQYIKREGLLKGIKSSTLRKMRLDLVVRNDPQEFGSDETYNTRDEDWFSTAYRHEMEKIHRLPLYGVAKFKKEDRAEKLSTNLVNTMIAYCNMANTYNSFSNIIDALEVGRDVLKERQVNGLMKDQGTSRAYTRYSKYMDKQVYNLRKTEMSRITMVNGMLNFLNKMAALGYLGGNIPGGVVNLGTGVINLINEAGAGEFMSKGALAKAFGLYMGNIPYMLAEDLSGKQEIGSGLSKMSLFLEKMNSNGDSKTSLSHFEKGFTGYVQQVLSPMDIAMAPYSIGENLMQGVTYVAMALDTKLIDPTTGEATNVWEAYNKVKKRKGIYKYEIEMSKKYLRPEVLDSTKKWYGAEKYYNQALEFKNALQNAINTYDIIGATSLSLDTLGGQDFSDLLTYLSANLNINPDAKLTDKKVLEHAMFQVNTFLEEVTWGTDAESDLMDKAREINNRLHGIYNKQDKTAMANNIVGATLLVFKNYVLGYIQNKFAPDHYSPALGKNVEGSFVTLAKVLYAPVGGIFNAVAFKGGQKERFFRDMLPFIILPYSNYTERRMAELGFSKNQMFNMRRNINTATIILFLQILRQLSTCKDDLDKEKDKIDKMNAELMKNYLLFSAEELKEKEKEIAKATKKYERKLKHWEWGPQPSKDYSDETKNNLFWGRINYFSTRLGWEQTAYMQPTAMWQEWRGVSDLNPVAFSIMRDIYEIISYSLSGEVYAGSSPNGRYDKGDKKWKVKLEKLTPIPIPYRNEEGNLDFFWKYSYWDEHPYESQKAWEYGVKLRSGK